MLRRVRRLLCRTQRSCGAQHHEKNPTPDHFALAQLGLDAIRAQVAFPLRRPLSVPAKEILVLEDGVQLLEEWSKRDRRLQSLEERIPSGLVGNLRQIALPVTYAEHAMARSTDPGGVQRVNDH